MAPTALKLLAGMLLQVCKNPTQPGFNHFLFESAAALVRFGAAADAAMLDQAQHQLFPAFQVVLSVRPRLPPPAAPRPQAVLMLEQTRSYFFL